MRKQRLNFYYLIHFWKFKLTNNQIIEEKIEKIKKRDQTPWTILKCYAHNKSINNNKNEKTKLMLNFKRKDHTLLKCHTNN